MKHFVRKEVSYERTNKNKLALLPDQPGCYLMKDKNGTIIYVGKAKILKTVSGLIFVVAMILRQND